MCTHRSRRIRAALCGLAVAVALSSTAPADAQAVAAREAGAAPPSRTVDGYRFTLEPWHHPLEAPPSLPPLMSRGWSLGLTATVYATVNTWTYFAWYRNRTTTSDFVWHDEGWFAGDTYAGGSDKLGHLWGAYAVQRLITNTLKAGGWGRGSSNLLGALAIMSYLTFIEFKDAYHVGYGFSITDMMANLFGTALGVAMDVHPRLDQMFDLRLEYVPSREYWKRLTEDGVVNAGEDYTGQTYILAFHLASLAPLQRQDAWGFLRMLDITLAYNTEHYLPHPLSEDALPTRNLSFGVALNVQYLLDRLFGASRPNGYGHALTQLVTDVVAVPYTNLPLLVMHRATSEGMSQ